jgi:hypothetical protein
MQQHKDVINKFEVVLKSMHNELSESLTADFGIFTHFFKTITDKDTFIYPEFLYLLYCFAWKIFVAVKINDEK